MFNSGTKNIRRVKGKALSMKAFLNFFENNFRIVFLFANEKGAR
jgi:hypothetical protein